MLAALVVPFVVVLALGLRAWRARHVLDGPAVRRTLWRFAGSLLALRLGVALVARGHGGPLALLGCALAALATLVAWADLSWLAAKSPRRRDLGLRLPFAVMALVLALMHASVEGVAFATAIAVMAWRWPAALDTRERFLTTLGALVLLAAFLLVHLKPADANVAKLPALARAAWTLARWGSTVTIVYTLFGLRSVFLAFASDPSLGIRTVSRRLGLSHLLVVLVPVLITVGLWLLTTWLGVGADRALTARRTLEHDARRLRAELGAALAAPGGPGGALAFVASAHHGAWPGVRTYLVEHGALTRTAGDSLAGERWLPGWPARGDSIASLGIIDLERHRYLGALRRDSVGGRAAIALVPIDEVLKGELERVVGAQLLMKTGRSMIDDSLRSARARERNARAPKPGVVRFSRAPSPASPALVMYGDERDTLETSDGVFTARGVQGMAEIHGVTFQAGQWLDSDASLRAFVPFGATLVGLFADIGENPLKVIPILILLLLALMLLPVAIFNFRLVGRLGGSFTRPVAALRSGTRALGAGQLDYRIPVAGDDELWETARAFNTMAEGLERGRELQKQRDRMESELELARRIQARLLPAQPPVAPGLEIAGRSESAREVGGDYYDHLVLEDGRVLLVIADVSGKGAGAALLMSAFRAALVSQDGRLAEPEVLAARLNAFLHRSVESGRFVTAFFGLLDGRSGKLVYSNAGHNPPVLLRADGRVDWLAAGGLILGILPDSAFERGETALAPGDLLAIYTDGVTEGADSSQEQFGEERLVASLRRLSRKPCAEAAEALVREVRQFEGEQGPADDITVLLGRLAQKA